MSRRNKVIHKRKLPKSTIVFRSVVIAFAVCVIGAAGFLIYHALVQNSVQSEQTPSSQAPSSTIVSSKPESKVPDPVSITILGAGDNLIHDGIYKQANQRTGGSGYDFKPVYEHVKPLIQSADIAVINQETVLAGKIAQLSGYPMFNSPTEVGDALTDLGFDVVNHANNHLLDKGVKGINATLDYWDTQKNVSVVGAYRDEEDLQNIRIVESKGIKTAHLGFAEMTNGLSFPADSDVRMVYTSETDKIEKLIKKAKSMADVVVVSVHWGNENTFTLTENQTTLAQNMVEWGADIIFGNHAHVVQKLDVLTRESDGAKCPVIYAMGNFVSAQAYGLNMVSGLLSVTVTKDFETNKTTFTSMKFTPIVTQYESGYRNIRVYPLSEYTAELAASHGVRARTGNFNLDYIHNIINQNIPEEYLDV